MIHHRRDKLSKGNASRTRLCLVMMNVHIFQSQDGNGYGREINLVSSILLNAEASKSSSVRRNLTPKSHFDCFNSTQLCIQIRECVAKNLVRGLHLVRMTSQWCQDDVTRKDLPKEWAKAPPPTHSLIQIKHCLVMSKNGISIQL